jgi:hypothetical protein
MYQQLWGYKVEEKLYLGVREQKRLNTSTVRRYLSSPVTFSCSLHAQLCIITSGWLAYRESPNYEHNSFLKTCTKFECTKVYCNKGSSVPVLKSMYNIKVTIYGQQTKQQVRT